MHVRSRSLLAALLAVAVSLPLGGCRLKRYEEQQENLEYKVAADSVEKLMRDATDLSKPNFVRRMLALYDTGQVISASGGRVTTTRDSLAMGIRAFWQNVGQNMHQPKWVWEHVYVDVPSTRAAVFTGTYRIPHRTPAGHPHEIGGAWTAMFAKRDGKWVIVQEHLSDWPVMPESVADSIADADARKRQGQPVAAPTDHTRH